MTVENISWSISSKECCRPRRGLNPRPPGLQSDGASNWATEAGLTSTCARAFANNWQLPFLNQRKDRLTVEIILWSISIKAMWPSWNLNLRHLDLKSAALPTAQGISAVKYSWLSLSRPRLSRITAYLEVKIWSLPKHENITTGKKYCGKEEKLLLRSNFSSFPQYFQYIPSLKNLIT